MGCCTTEPENAITIEDASVIAAERVRFSIIAGDMAQKTPGQAHQQLVEWNKANLKLCKDVYERLSNGASADRMGTYRCHLNEKPELFFLNAVRRGVKRVMVEKQREAEIQKYEEYLAERDNEEKMVAATGIEPVTSGL